MNIGELFIALGFDVDDKKLKAFKEDIKDGLNSLLKMSAAGAAAVYAINRIVEGSISSALAFRNISLESGLATESIQRMAHVMAEADPSKSPLQYAQQIQKAGEILANAKWSGGDIKSFAMLGIAGFQRMNALQLHDALVAAAAAHANVFNDPVFTASLYNNTGFSAAELIAESRLSKDRRDRAYNLPVSSKEQQDHLAAMGGGLMEVQSQLESLQRDLTLEYGDSFVEFMKEIPAYLKKFSDYMKPVNEALHSMGLTNFDEIAAGIGAISLSVAAANPAMSLLAISLSGVVFSLHEIGEYMKDPNHSWKTWFADAGGVLKNIATDRHVLNAVKESPAFLASIERRMNVEAERERSEVNQTNHMTINTTGGKQEWESWVNQQQAIWLGMARQNFVPWGQ